jgi:hypothetical protein
LNRPAHNPSRIIALRFEAGDPLAHRSEGAFLCLGAESDAQRCWRNVDTLDHAADLTLRGCLGGAPSGTGSSRQ